MSRWIFLHNLRHIGYSHILLSFGQNYTRQDCDPAFSRTSEEEIFQLCNDKSVHKIVWKMTMLGCLLLLQGMSCWLQFEYITVSKL